MFGRWKWIILRYCLEWIRRIFWISRGWRFSLYNKGRFIEFLVMISISTFSKIILFITRDFSDAKLQSIFKSFHFSSFLLSLQYQWPAIHMYLFSSRCTQLNHGNSDESIRDNPTTIMKFLKPSISITYKWRLRPISQAFSHIFTLSYPTSFCALPHK